MRTIGDSIHVCMYVYMYMCICVYYKYVYIYICIYVCMYICIYIDIYVSHTDLCTWSYTCCTIIIHTSCICLSRSALARAVGVGSSAQLTFFLDAFFDHFLGCSPLCLCALPHMPSPVHIIQELARFAKEVSDSL